jgi:hypothetical protein
MHGLIRVEYSRQCLVHDFDGGKRSFSNERIFRGNRTDRFTDIADSAARHNRLIIDEHAKAVLARHIRARDDSFDALHRFRGRGVNRQDTGMGVRRTQDPYVQHPGHCHIAGIFEAARDLAWGIYSAHVFADEIALLGLVFR